MRKTIIAALVGTLFVVGATAASGKHNSISLKPSAGSCNGTGVGNGQNAQAQWTNKQAETGKFSVLVQKSADTANCSFAAIVVKGVEGMTMGDLGNISFSVMGYCGAGSPRFNA